MWARLFLRASISAGPALRPASARNAASPSDSRSHSDASGILPNLGFTDRKYPTVRPPSSTPTGALRPSSRLPNVAVGRPMSPPKAMIAATSIRSVADVGYSAKPISSATRAMFAPAPVTVRTSPRSITVARVKGSSRPRTAQSEEVDAARSHVFTEGAQRRPGELAVGQHEIGRDARDVEQLGVVDLVAQHPRALDDCRPATPDRNHIVSLEGRGWRHIDERGPAAKPLDRHPTTTCTGPPPRAPFGRPETAAAGMLSPSRRDRPNRPPGSHQSPSCVPAPCTHRSG